jgi:GNAT superfamily N-acetyltransferase
MDDPPGGNAPGEQSSPGQPLRLLMDTNVFIAIEPFDGGTEKGLALGAKLVRLVGEQGHILLVHPATVDDVQQGKDERRKRQQLAELDKYSMLQEGKISSSLAERAGSSRPGSNDHRDLRILAALDSHAATYLVSEDIRLRKRARRSGLGEAVLTVEEAVALLEESEPGNPSPPPHVREVASYTLDIEQEIFTSLRGDYGSDFDTWLNKVRADSKNRICMIVEDDDSTYAALAIAKRERECEYGLPEPILKISTFKVAENHAGFKYGELLLKSILKIATQRDVASLYVEVFGKHTPMIDFLETFGFSRSPHQTQRGELVYVKHLRPTADSSSLTALEFHKRFGPPAIKTVDRSFVVPIIPRWHHKLFPDSPVEPEYMQMFIPGLEVADNHPSGNALLKAYICNSNIDSLEPGDALFFYRSHDLKAITTLGVVEHTLRSSNPQQVMTFVGRRTVYRPDEISQLCGSVRGALAILFRQDRFIDPPWELAELQAQGVLRAWPQTIVHVSEKGSEWLHRQVIG